MQFSTLISINFQGVNYFSFLHNFCSSIQAQPGSKAVAQEGHVNWIPASSGCEAEFPAHGHVPTDQTADACAPRAGRFRPVHGAHLRGGECHLPPSRLERLWPWVGQPDKQPH